MMQEASPDFAPHYRAVVVDDDMLYRNLLRTALADRGWYGPILEFSDGLHFIDWLKQIPRPEAPFVVFLDIDMPRMTGLETAKEMKKHSPELLSKTVMISSASTQSKMAQAKEIGVLAFYEKPMDFSGLVRVVWEVLTNLLSKVQRP